jgi:hypothetical protein
MGKIVDMVGQKFEKLTVESFAGYAKNGRYRLAAWYCICECGNRVKYLGSQLRNGAATKCGHHPNRTSAFGDAVIIWLEHKGYEVPCYIDVADYDLVKEHRWYASKGSSKTFYARAPVRGSDKQVLMHVLLEGKGTDHRDQNGTNNRRENLRPASDAENTRNRDIFKNNTSGFKGVYPEGTKFYVLIMKDGKHYRLGRFATALEATRAYNKAAKELHGEFAVLNELPEDDLIFNQKPDGN